MKLSDVIKVRGTLLQVKNAKMPIKTSYQIARFLQKTDVDSTFYTEKYQEIISNCAMLDENNAPILAEDGLSIKIREDKLQECIDLLKELESTEVKDFDLKINIDDLENAGLTVEQLYILMDYIVE